MRFEHIGKTKATFVGIDIQSVKVGQTDVKPAVVLHLKVMLANASLNMLNKTVLPFYYEKGNREQATLDGVDVISETPALTEAALKLGALNWDDEQTGCKLKIYQGVTGDQDLKLGDGTVRKVKADPKEGGAVEWNYQYFTTDVDQDTLGALAVLKSLERDIELTAPEAVSSKQKTLAEANKEEEKTLTPAAALKKAVKDEKPAKGKPEAKPGKNVSKAVPPLKGEEAWPFPKAGRA